MEELDFIEGCVRLKPLIEGRANCTLDEIKAGLAGGKFYDCSGAIIYVRGHEIHASCPDDARGIWISRRAINSLLNPIIEKYGFAVTSATTKLGEEFVSRLGFKKEGNQWILRAKYGR